MPHQLQGIGTALITPFTSNLEIDFESLKNLLDFNSENGVGYFVVNGTTGEAATTNKAEKRQLLEFVKDNNPKGLPVVYGTGGYDTADIVEHVKEMNWDGVHSLLSVSPYYNRPSQKGIIAHYRAVADACPRPVILYNVPKRTGSNLTAETTLALAEHPNIIGVKEASGDLEQIIGILSNKPDDFVVISGDDMGTVSMVAIGAIGAISVLSNAFPKKMSDMVRFALEGQFQKAAEILYDLNRVNPFMYSESSPVGVKETLGIMGMINPAVRLPLVAGSDSLRASIKKYLAY